MRTITVIKQDYLGQETLRYTGQLIERFPHKILIEAFFDREETIVEGIILKRGDRFIETYYDNRWYNIFEIHAQEDDHIKGWYCNICYPTTLSEEVIAYRDLALDLLVYPDGRRMVLDEDEFSSLPLPPKVRSAAHQALDELQVQFPRDGIMRLPR
jgi:predicted RNA-binding protein associated with RNAse of E/G family